MRPRDRQLRIIDLVRTQGKVSVDELVQEFSSSAETIRRDLTMLSANGKIKKIHGGALPLRDFGEGAFAQRMLQNAEAKRLIADKARQLVSPGDSLFIDTGSTTLVVAEALATIDELTVTTNSTAIARIIGSANETTRIYLLGGAYNEDNRQTCGAMALNQLDGFHGNLAVVTVGAVSADGGVMDYNFDEAAIASAMIARSERVVILADASKFDRVAPFVVASFEQIDVLVSDRKPQGLLAERLNQATVEVL
ncbi:MAG: DeoR/GlpR transcriptional regulator [Gammaproteobacteria bacterium]|nr:DeoR/GlpR transcriptional regulator [Gammaproteobacteria bacterium]